MPAWAMPAATRAPAVSPPSIPPVPRGGGGAASNGLRCAQCGTAIPSGFKFCGACGLPVGGPVVSPAVARRPARARAMLLASDGSIVGHFPLVADETTVGSAGDVRITDPFTAPVQGRLVFRGARLSFLPEPAPNGTFMLIRQKTELAPGAEIRIGRQLLRLERQPPAPPKGAEPRWGSPDPGYRMRLVQVLAGGADGDSFPMREGENLLGRTNGDVTFAADGYVSGRHASLTVRGERVVLEDLGSSNGTFVRLAQETNIDPGDLLLVGDQLLRIDPP